MFYYFCTIVLFDIDGVGSKYFSIQKDGSLSYSLDIKFFQIELCRKFS